MKKLCAATMLLLWISMGCSTNVPSTDTKKNAQAEKNTKAPAKEIGLELISVKDLPTQLAARKGKVVVLDMWATF